MYEALKYDFKQLIEKPNVLELYIYSEVCPNGYDWWTGEEIESKTSAEYFKEKLNEYKNVEEIIVYINSMGGYVREGYGIYAQLKRHTAKKTIYIDGFANSIASIIAMAGDYVIMYLNSMMGIHNAMDACYGNAAGHRKCADDLDKLMEGNRQIYLDKSNGKITLEKLTELLDAETMLTAQECLQYGLCDEIISRQADTEKLSQMMQVHNNKLAQELQRNQQIKQSFIQAMDAFNQRKTQTTPKASPAEAHNEQEIKPETFDLAQKLFEGLLQSTAKNIN